MGSGRCYRYSNTYGAKKKIVKKKKLWKPLSLFTQKGHITERRISANRDFFYNKTKYDIANELNKMGYKTNFKGSKYSNSKAEIIEITNHDKDKNIMQVQLSLDPNNRHKVPYVKISTSDIGKFKVVNGTKKEYVGQGNEKAKIFFKRNKRRRK
ncbi:hypothetical protein IJJ97_02595 [bacterium]|nr:hypothetical protein [bacterium]